MQNIAGECEGMSHLKHFAIGFIHMHHAGARIHTWLLGSAEGKKPLFVCKDVLINKNVAQCEGERSAPEDLILYSVLLVYIFAPWI